MLGHSAVCCQICGSDRLKNFPSVEKLARVTSDSQPFPPGGNVSICHSCGTVQTLPTDTWQKEISEIYNNYRIYSLSGGVEQGVMAPTGEMIRRSSVLARKIHTVAGLSERGRMLDIGCGNGAMLASFSEEMRLWDLYGMELDDKYRSVVESIPGVRELIVGDLDMAEGNFDVITMLHAIEHFVDPVAFLVRLRERLIPNGVLFIEVPNFRENPFDLLVADHCCHFTAESLTGLVRRAGFEVISISEDWVKKELSLLARPTAALKSIEEATLSEIVKVEGLVERSVTWLFAVRDMARSLAEMSPIGLFGTSLAATWIYGEVGGRASFFVDEDPSRHGRYFDLPVIGPDDVASGSDVFLPFPHNVATEIANRFAGRDFILHRPPAT